MNKLINHKENGKGSGVGKYNEGFNGLSLEEREGARRGGEKFQELLNLLGGDRERRRQGGEKYTWKEQVIVIERYLNDTRSWFDLDAYYQKIIKSGGLLLRAKSEGSEGAILFEQNGKGEKSVIKLIDWKTWMLTANPTPFDFLIHKICLQNAIFPSVHYELMGVQKIEDRTLHFVMRQPLVEHRIPATRQEIREDMIKRGFSEIDNHDFVSNHYRVYDLHLENALRGIDGKLYYIDPIITRR